MSNVGLFLVNFGTVFLLFSLCDKLYRLSQHSHDGVSRPLPTFLIVHQHSCATMLPSISLRNFDRYKTLTHVTLNIKLYIKTFNLLRFASLFRYRPVIVFRLPVIVFGPTLHTVNLPLPQRYLTVPDRYSLLFFQFKSIRFF